MSEFGHYFDKQSSVFHLAREEAFGSNEILPSSDKEARED